MMTLPLQTGNNPKHEPFAREGPNESDPWVIINDPYNTLPPIECYVSPPLAVINGGPKLDDAQTYLKTKQLEVDAIASTYHKQESGETQVVATTERLTLLSDIWHLIEGAKGDAEKWRDFKTGKRKRDPGDDDIEPNSPKSSRTGMTTRSTSKSQGKSEPTRQPVRETRYKNSGTSSRELDTTLSLTGDVLAQLGKSIDNKRIIEWVEATARRRMK
jgi:hypothetical protein